MHSRAAGLGFVVFLIAIGVAFMIEALRYRYWASFGPGAGFLPRWLAGGFLLCCVALVIEELRAGVRVDFDASGFRRIAATISLMGAAVLVTPVIGLMPALALLMFLLSAFIEKNTLAASLAVSVGVAASVFVVFGLWLGVQFPEMYFFRR
jgi:hypothetical protein